MKKICIIGLLVIVLISGCTYLPKTETISQPTVSKTLPTGTLTETAGTITETATPSTTATSTPGIADKINLSAVNKINLSAVNKINLSMDYNGRQIELTNGQTFNVTLETNPSTGSSWEVVELNNNILHQIGEAETEPNITKRNMVGVPVMHTFQFEVINTGQLLKSFIVASGKRM